MTPRPFKLLNQTELSYFKRTLSATVEAWANTWFCRPLITEVTCKNTVEHAVKRTQIWHHFQLDKLAPIWLAHEPAAEIPLINDLFGTHLSPFSSQDFSAPVLTKTLLQLWQDLSERFYSQLLYKPYPDNNSGSSLTISEKTPDVAWNKMGSGSLTVMLTLSGQCYTLVLSPELVSQAIKTALPAKQPVIGSRLKERLDLLKSVPVCLPLSIDEIELTVNDLKTLKVGDIIQLNAKVGSAFQLASSGQKFAKGFLGSYQTHKAFQLTANKESTSYAIKGKNNP